MMEWKIVLAALVLFTVLAASEAGKNITMDGHLYWSSHPLMKNWYEAQRHCNYHGMVLVEIPDEDENNRVLTIIKDAGSSQYWTGGTDLGSEGNFYWVTSGHSVVFSDYSVPQPDNNGGNEHCLEIRNDYGWKWNDQVCLQKKYFVCRDLSAYPFNNCNSGISPRMNVH